MNKFANINLTKKINAKADQLGLAGIDREVFCLIAKGCGDVGFETFRRVFSGRLCDAMQSLANLIELEVIFTRPSSNCWYAVAV